MQSRFDLGVFSILLLVSVLTFASSQQSGTFQTSARVPIVNECNGIPKLFRKDWQYRTTFGVIIEKGDKVKFELLNSQLLADGEFFFSCLQNTMEDDLVFPFSKKTSLPLEIVAKVTCVPTVSVLKLCNSPPVDLMVRLTSMNKMFAPLPVIEFNSFETYSFNKSDVDDFLKRIQYYGFAISPKVQVLIGRGDVEELRRNNLFLDGLKVINDVIEKYNEYSGRTSIPIEKGRRINMALEKDVLLLKSEQCSRMNNRRFFTNSMCINEEPHQFGYRIPCSSNAAGYYGFDKIVAVGDQILPFFAPDAKNWLLLHELGHHFDLYTTDYFMNVQEIWVNIYASFYQSRFLYENQKDYWMHEDFTGGVSSSQKQYDAGTLLRDFSANYRERAHFLMALFTLDNHDSSVFRSYNIRTMNDSKTTENILKSIAIFIKDQYNVNVAPFIERAIYYKSIPWLNLTNTYDLIDSNNYRMPCFYFESNENDYPRYRFEEHYLKSVSNLRLCSTNQGPPNKIKITIGNPDLMNKRVNVNLLSKQISKLTIELESSEKVFAFWGAINKTAVISPIYTFCNFKTSSRCTVAPKLLTYSDENPSELLPPFRFDILGDLDQLIAILQVDISNRTMMIKTLKENGRLIYPAQKGPYVEVKLYNGVHVEQTSFKIYGTGTNVGEFKFNIGLNYTFEVNAVEKSHVRILDYNLNDLGTNKFKIDKFGVSDVPIWHRKIRDRFAKILSDDLEYKPYLKKYQHLTDLLRILKNNVLFD